MLQAMHQKGEKGFTLVELMIVVAIIGILAAIAIPQFAQYRIRGFNSSAMSDLRNLTTAQEAFFADWQTYAVTHDASEDDLTNVREEGTPLTGPSTANKVIAQLAQGAHRQIGVSIGNLVSIIASTDENGVSYTAVSKHLQGNTVFGSDSDSSAMYRNQDLLNPGDGAAELVDALPDPIAGEDDFAGIGDWAAQ